MFSDSLCIHIFYLYTSKPFLPTKIHQYTLTAEDSLQAPLPEFNYSAQPDH